MLPKIGEVVESCTNEFVAECYELHNPPSLGSLVRAGDGEVEIYGVVCNAVTQSIDQGRRPLARGREETNEEDIYRQHPQLSRLLRTTFDTLIIGHGTGGTIYRYLPPRPPRVHSFVYLCSSDEVRRFTQTLDFLPTLLNTRTELGDEVLAACLRLASNAHDDRSLFLVRSGKEIAVLLSGELNRLNAILRRIKQ